MEYDDLDQLEDDNTRPDCECDDPDPVNDEPWVPIQCGNCGGLL